MSVLVASGWEPFQMTPHNMNQKLALGTVQFGLEYGIANKSGQVSIQQINSILEYARNNTINTLDTAIGYGDSEERLGQFGLSGWDVITKLPTLPESIKDVRKWVRQAVEKSILRLQTGYINGLLLHRPNDLLNKHGDDLYESLKELQKDGLVQKIGASIYVPEELESLCPKYNFDIIQAPFNVLDRRLKESGWLSRLSEQGTEIHVRSVFLQGLLLMSSKNRPDRFKRWNLLWNKWHSWLSEANISTLQACLGYVLSEFLFQSRH